MPWSPGPGATPGNDYFLGGDGGDTVDGQGGDDILNGMGGNDSLTGGTGNDTLFGADGNDTFSGGSGDDYAYDTDGNDIFYGGSGNDTFVDVNSYSPYGDTTVVHTDDGNDLIQISSSIVSGTLDGGADYDTLEFFVGNEDYAVDLTTFFVTGVERLNANMALYGDISDFTQFSVLRYSASDSTLGAQMSLTLLEAGTINLAGKLSSQSAYIAVDGSANNDITSGAGNDHLVGGANRDTLDGGAGGDLIEGGEGYDQLYGRAGADSLYGGNGNDTAQGGDDNDLIYDYSGSDALYGQAGNDTIYNDYLVSGTYNDYIDGGDGDDEIYLAANPHGKVFGGTGTDSLLLYLSAGSSMNFSNLAIDGVENLYTRNVTLAASVAQLESFDTIRITGAPADLAVPILLALNDGGTLDLSSELGVQTVHIVADLDAAADAITTGSGNDTIEATGYDDTLSGGAGNDSLYANYGLDTLNGGSGNDVLDGGQQADRMSGGSGDDTYYVDDTADRAYEFSAPGVDDGGYDRVFASASFTLGAFIEDLVLTGASGDTNGAGNAQDNTITGDSHTNVLRGMGGNDVLDGGAGGSDRLYGGVGNDTYSISGTSRAIEDTVSGTDDGGTDIVYAANSYVLGNFIENLTLTGAGVTATGNALNNTLRGTAGSNTLDGKAGADTMYGGGGNDYYYVDNAADLATEQTVAGIDDGGTDRVYASADYILGDFIENLTLTGTAVKGTGNALANIITGNAANNRLTGGLGADRFVFAHFGAANGVDHLTDFVSGTDKLAFTAADFGFTSGHHLAATEISLTGSAAGPGAQFVYSPTTHILYWDANGATSGGLTSIMVFDNAGTPATGDFIFT